MKSVWVIEQGSYSDYHVVGVYSSKKSAERVLLWLKGDYETPTIAEWPLDPGASEVSAGLDRYHVLMLRDGTVETVARVERNTYALEDDTAIWRRSRAPFYKGSNTPDVLRANIWAKNDQHAVKSANELRIQMIACGEWE